MRVSVPLRPTLRTAVRPRATGLIAVIAAALLAGCSEQAASLPLPAAAAGVTMDAPLAVTSTTRNLTLTHWTAATLPVAFNGGQGRVSLRMERADGEPDDTITVTPATIDTGSAPQAVTLRATRVAFPAPEDAAPWKLIASQDGRDVASLDLSVTLKTVDFDFTVQPVTAAEGQTVDAILTVDADVRDLPPFTFSLSPYIPEESESYEPAPRTYAVTTLPATFRVPIAFGTFHGDPASNTATFQMTVDGLADSLGSNRYIGKYERANLTWNLAR